MRAAPGWPGAAPDPSGWPRPKGYSNGIVAKGNIIFISGMVGWNDKEEFESNDFSAQALQTFRNIVRVLNEADAGPENIVRMTWYLRSVEEYNASLKDLGKAYRDVLGKVYPAMSAVEVSRLIEKDAKLEIEVTAVIES